MAERVIETGQGIVFDRVYYKNHERIKEEAFYE